MTTDPFKEKEVVVSFVLRHNSTKSFTVTEEIAKALSNLIFEDKHGKIRMAHSGGMLVLNTADIVCMNVHQPSLEAANALYESLHE